MANALMYDKHGTDGSVSVTEADGRVREFKKVRGVFAIPEHLLGRLIGSHFERYTGAKHQPEKPTDDQLGPLPTGQRKNA